MNSRSLSTLAIIGFVVLGGICMGLRYRSIEQQQIAQEDSLWELTYDVDFTAETLTSQEEARVRLSLPFETPYCDVVNENQNTWNIPNPNVSGSPPGRPSERTGNRLLLLKTRQSSPEPYAATAKFILHLSPRAHSEREPALENLTADARTWFLREEGPKRSSNAVTGDIPISNVEVQKVAQSAPDDSETEAQRLQWIFNYCSGIDSTPDAAGDSVVDAVQFRRGTPLGRARTMVTLCRALRFPARLVTGFIVRQGAKIEPHVWVEVFQKQAWVPFDPTNGYSLSLPMNYVPVRRDAEQIHNATANVTMQPPGYSIKRLAADPRVLRGEEQHPIQILDLKRLPVTMHPVMKILLLLPFAALITACMRNVIGLGTFGTFSPALLAMSFIFADLKTGLAVLIIVVGVGLFGRSFLERLRLLTVPRLSIILTMVVLCVVFGLSLLHYVLPRISAEVVLLPMVILTMLIERFHVSMEEDGLVYTVQLAVGTLVVALLCYLVLKWPRIGDLVLTYPEMHFFTIAIFIMLGRYAGYRLTELWRFRDLVEPSEPGR